MKIQDMIKNIHKGSKHLGTFSLHELFQFASSRNYNGIAVAKENGREYYLAFLAGEAEGAIYIDENGTEYSDKAAKMISGHEKFEFYEITPDIVETIVMRCRIFEKTHLKKSIPNVIHDLLDNIIRGFKIHWCVSHARTLPLCLVREIQRDCRGKRTGSGILPCLY